MMKVPNEPGLSPNNGLENVFLSDQSMASQMSLYASWCQQRYQTNVRCVKHRPSQDDKAISPQEEFSSKDVPRKCYKAHHGRKQSNQTQNMSTCNCS